MRERYDEIQGLGAEVVAVGTGRPEHAADFIAAERVPFPVLSDADGEAARAARIQRVGMLKLFHPDSWAGARRAWKSGHRIHAGGRRVDQLGATFVVGPGDRLRYEHYDAHTADHAPMEEIFGALREGSA